MDKSILVPISQGSEELEAVAIIDILRRGSIDVIVAGEHDIISCSRKVRILPDILIEEIDEDDHFDGIILPGGSTGVKNLTQNETIIKITKDLYNSGKLVGAICAAPTILAENRIIPYTTSITSHPSVATQLSDYNYLEHPVIVDKNVITSRGAGTAVQFALTILEYIKGPEKANQVAKDIIF